MSRPLRSLLPTSMLLLAVVLAGCGGSKSGGSGSGHMSRDDYVKREEAIGNRYATENRLFKSRVQQAIQAQSKTKLVDAFRFERDLTRRAASDLGALDPPSDLAPANRGVVDAMRAFAGDVDGVVTAYTKGDKTKLSSFFAQVRAGGLASARRLQSSIAELQAKLNGK